MTLVTELEGDDRTVALADPPRSTSPGRVNWRTLLRPLMLASVLLAGGRASPAAAATPMVRQDTTVGQATPALPPVQLQFGDQADGLRISGTVGVVVFMAILTLLPAVFLMMTSFTRILIVLHFLRSALGTQSTPPGQLLAGIAVMLTGVVMAPTLERANQAALQPYLSGEMTQIEAYQAALVPFRDFMLANTRDAELGTFAEIAGQQDVASLDELPTMTIMSSFVVSELKSAFLIGFAIFLPFTVLDLVVASVLMSMGMFMLPPVMVSLPFKLLLFVMADGWSLVVQNLIASFRF